MTWARQRLLGEIGSQWMCWHYFSFGTSKANFSSVYHEKTSNAVITYTCKLYTYWFSFTKEPRSSWNGRKHVQWRSNTSFAVEANDSTPYKLHISKRSRWSQWNCTTKQTSHGNTISYTEELPNFKLGFPILDAVVFSLLALRWCRILGALLMALQKQKGMPTSK